MLIEAEGLHKSFGSVAAVRGISLRVARGERVGVLGPNGAGKSTTLRMLAGTLAPDRGWARIAGQDVVAGPLNARAAIGYLPEAANGFSSLTVAEFVIFAAQARGLAGQSFKAAVNDIIERLDLGGVGARRGHICWFIRRTISRFRLGCGGHPDDNFEGRFGAPGVQARIPDDQPDPPNK